VQADGHGDDTDDPPVGSGPDETTVYRVVAPHEAETTVFRAAPAEDQTAVYHVPPGPAGTNTAGYERVPRQSPNRRRGRVRFRMVVAFALVIAAAVAAAVVVGLRSERHDTDPLAGIATDTPDLKHPPQRDFTIDTCTITRDGALVGGAVTNHSANRADYALDAVLVDQSGAVVTRGIATVTGVDPGAKASWQTTLPPQPSTATQTECKVVKIDRYQSKA
jgi:hypothetical protein